jgi:hypothetical protein
MVQPPLVATRSWRESDAVVRSEIQSATNVTTYEE